MPPAPVCIILEDDAILVDRFVDRLESLLEEMPHDFHFCLLGYSRPGSFAEVLSTCGYSNISLVSHWLCVILGGGTLFVERVTSLWPCG